ncbi:MAG: hypothetical protein AAFU60_06875 [Bacteroidota bacterium]
MAKFFRKIRQHLLEERRVANYVLYAIGEIILVVIGILIAIQLNEVNQDRERAQLEEVLLEQVKFEIISIYSDIWRDANNLALGEQSHQLIAEYIEQQWPYADSLCFAFYWLKRDEYIYPTTAAYSKLQREGLDIIQDDSIRFYLQSLYEGQFTRLTKNGSLNPDVAETFDAYYLEAFRPNIDLDLTFDYLLPSDTVGNVVFEDVDYHYPKKNQRTIGYVPLDFNALRKDPKFLMLLEQTKQHRDSKLFRYEITQFIIKKLIGMIDTALEEEE